MAKKPEMTGPAPAFALPGSDGETHSLADHEGQPVVLYFYPKDDTPGCTREACDFRDNMARIEAAGAVVYGVSKDSLDSHEKFIAKYDLPFVLLSDEDLKVHEAYDAWGEKTLYGKKVTGVIRSTFVIDGNGEIAKQWRNLRVKGHVDRVLGVLEGL